MKEFAALFISSRTTPTRLATVMDATRTTWFEGQASPTITKPLSSHFWSHVRCTQVPERFSPHQKDPSTHYRNAPNTFGKTCRLLQPVRAQLSIRVMSPTLMPRNTSGCTSSLATPTCRSIQLSSKWEQQRACCECWRNHPWLFEISLLIIPFELFARSPATSHAGGLFV